MENVGGLRQGSVNKWEGKATLDKKCFHLQAFGLEILMFAEKAAKIKELRERDRHFNMVGVKRQIQDVTMRVSGLVEH